MAGENPIRAFETNVLGTLNLLEACRHLHTQRGEGSHLWRGVEAFLCVSTDHVFGDELPSAGFAGHKETESLGYGGPYEASKAAMEFAVRSYGPGYMEWNDGPPPAIAITRCANCFGPGDIAYRRVIPNFLKSAMNHGRIDLDCRKNGRQFIHVGDAVGGYILAASAARRVAKDRPRVFHFAIDHYDLDGLSQRWISMKQLAGLIGSVVGPHVVVGESSTTPDWAPNENKIQALNCDRTHRELGWRANWKLRDGVEELREWKLAPDDDARQILMGNTVHEILNRITTAKLAEPARMPAND